MLVADTDGLTAVWVRVQKRLFEGLTVSVKATMPAKPLTPFTVMVEDPFSPVLTVTTDGLASRVKSWTAKLTSAERDSEPIEAVTATLYVPEEPLQERVDEDEPPRVRVDGLSVHVRPEGEMEEVRETMPDKPLTLAMVNVDVPLAEVTMVTLDGVTVIARSCTVKLTVVKCEREPLTAVIVTE